MKRRTLIQTAPIAALMVQSCGLLRGSAGGGPSSADEPPLAKDEGERRILAVLDEMAEAGKTYLSVPTDDGRWLRLLTETAGAKHVVEVGTSTGYSGLWLLLALRNTGGKLTTFEMDKGRAETARGHFKQAGVSELATIVVGNAHQEIPKLQEPVDVAFIDADKSGYPHYLEMLKPMVRPGGLILAHNINMSREYRKAITGDPDFESVFYMGGGGLSVTLKKAGG